MRSKTANPTEEVIKSVAEVFELARSYFPNREHLPPRKQVSAERAETESGPEPEQTQRHKQVTAYVDGACFPNPAPGAYGVLLSCGKHEKRISGRVPEEPTTAPRAELYAAIKALEALREPCDVVVFSDSAYLIRTMLGEYGRRSNVDLWEMLDAVAAPNKVTWTWVRSHAGNRGNEIAHRLAEAVA